jgi:hypothetical protein
MVAPADAGQPSPSAIINLQKLSARYDKITSRLNSLELAIKGGGQVACLHSRFDAISKRIEALEAQLGLRNITDAQTSVGAL